MANLACWYLTAIPEDLTTLIRETFMKTESDRETSKVRGETDGFARLVQVKPFPVRDSLNTWVSANTWLGGFMWYYIDKANKENFLYDLTQIENDTLQYTYYRSGQFYNWHADEDLSSYEAPGPILKDDVNPVRSNGHREEYIRKLSFSLQLSDEDSYEGGELQFLTPGGTTFFAPKAKGTLVVFDSRVSHRVRKVKSGVRESLVGWVLGPRWK